MEKTYGTLTPDLRQMCVEMLELGVVEAAMESTAVYWVPVWNVPVSSAPPISIGEDSLSEPFAPLSEALRARPVTSSIHFR